MPPKVDEFVPHPVKEQLPGVDFCINSCPKWPEAILLGFQHYLVMLGTSVFIPSFLVPLMGGGNVEKAQVINSLLFVSGINTLLQTSFGTRLPVVMGGSRAFLIPMLSTVMAQRFSSYLGPRQRFLKSMRATQGALIIAGGIQMLAGFLGFWRVATRYLSPLAAVPLVTLTGLGLFALGFPLMATCIEIGLPALILVVFLSQYLMGLCKQARFIVGRFSVLLAIALAFALAAILTKAGAYDNSSTQTQISCRVDQSGLIGAAPWIKLPYPFQWGTLEFDAGEGFAMVAAALVATIESTGTFIAAARFGSATHPPPCVFARGLGWQGIGTLISAFFGTLTGCSASVENAGLLGLTRVGSRRVIQISAVFMLFFSVLGKFGAVLASIPLPIFAAIYCVLFAYASSAGIGVLQFCNLNSFRSKFIVGFSIFMGLSVAQYFIAYFLTSGQGPVHTGSIWFNDIVQVIFSSPATVAIMVAYLLDCTHGRGESARRRDSGRHWWGKFTVFTVDIRSEEFYRLPYNLNKYFPSY